MMKMSSKARSIAAKKVWRNNPKPFENYSVNPNQFLKVETPQVAYILGFIWADGYLNHVGRAHNIGITILETDMYYLRPILNTTGRWNYYSKIQPVNGKIITQAFIANRPLYEFLFSCDYKAKSTASADKILNHIPKHLHKYWFRGLIDGDGCFYLTPNGNTGCFTIASSYHQNWDFLIKLASELQIEYRIYKQVTKVGRSSCFAIESKKNIVLIGNYAYDGFEQDNIGFPRKFNKLKEIEKITIARPNWHIARNITPSVRFVKSQIKNNSISLCP